MVGGINLRHHSPLTTHHSPLTTHHSPDIDHATLKSRPTTWTQRFAPSGADAEPGSRADRARPDHHHGREGQGSATVRGETGHACQKRIPARAAPGAIAAAGPRGRVPAV